MKTIPIIMGGQSVRCLLSGSKTVTRRALPADETRHASLLWPKGTRLWVKEAWWPRTGDKRRSEVLWRATDFQSDMIEYRSPLFMPRWASRITLEVEGVRVEKLHAITREDAWAEGISKHCEGCALGPDHQACTGCYDAVGKYSDLWDELNGKKAPWRSNPRIRRIEFHLVEAYERPKPRRLA